MGDTTEASLLLLEALALIDSRPLQVSLLAAGGDADRLKSRALSLPHQVDVEAGVVDDMVERLTLADLAVIAGVGTTWEAACVGVPSLILIVADNQRPNSMALQRMGVAIYLGRIGQVGPESIATSLHALICNAEQRAQMSCAAKTLVDGHGAGRVAAILHNPRFGS